MSFRDAVGRQRHLHLNCWRFEKSLKLPDAMPVADFHKKPFDEGTLTKLQIFELYAREWLPVFLAPDRPSKREVHVFDFFAGPGTDIRGELGSPLRLLRQLKNFEHLPAWSKVGVHAHFFDADTTKIRNLKD